MSDTTSPNLLSLLDPSFVSSLTPEAQQYLQTVPTEFRSGRAGYNALTNTVRLNPSAEINRRVIEEEALHALTLGMGTKGGGVGRLFKRTFYPGSWFGFSEEEKENLQTSYKSNPLLWLTQRGVESGPASWNLAGGDFGAMPQAAQNELNPFFVVPPPLSNANPPVDFNKPTVESKTSFLKVDQAPLPAPPSINKRRYQIRRAPKRKSKPKSRRKSGRSRRLNRRVGSGFRK